MTRRVDKVVIYITRGERLLVFTQPAYPEAGTQVPAGTVEAGEAVETAARREAREETGLERLTDWRYLGMRERDMASYGREEVQRRFFFHARCEPGDAPDAPDRWEWVERSPSSLEHGEEIVFALTWVPLGEAALVAEQGALLGAVVGSAAPTLKRRGTRRWA